MTIIQDLIDLHNKWDAEGGKSCSDRYEDALYKCINELGDLINKHEKDSEDRCPECGEKARLMQFHSPECSKFRNRR